MMIALWGGHGCDEKVQRDCLSNISMDCAPLYAPEFQTIWEETLIPRCALAGGACHSAEGAQGNLAFTDADASHQALVDTSSGVVLPGDVACSPLMVTLESADPSLVMPPGQPLSEAERCAIRQWIHEGALH